MCPSGLCSCAKCYNIPAREGIGVQKTAAVVVEVNRRDGDGVSTSSATRVNNASVTNFDDTSALRRIEKEERREGGRVGGARLRAI